MTQVTGRFIVNLEMVVTTEYGLDGSDVENCIPSEVKEAWNGVADLDLESIYVKSVEETPTEPVELVRWTAQRAIEEITKVARELKAEREDEGPW